jgi:hypothetical protein
MTDPVILMNEAGDLAINLLPLVGAISYTAALIPSAARYVPYIKFIVQVIDLIGGNWGGAKNALPKTETPVSNVAVVAPEVSPSVTVVPKP